MVTVNLPPFSSTSSPPFPWARAIPDLAARFDTPNLRAVLKTLGPKTLAKGEQPRLDAKCRCGEKEEGNEWKGEWQVVARQAREGEHWRVLNNFAIASHFAATICWISLSLSLARSAPGVLQLLSTQLDKKSSILIHYFRIQKYAHSSRVLHFIQSWAGICTTPDIDGGMCNGIGDWTWMVSHPSMSLVLVSS